MAHLMNVMNIMKHLGGYRAIKKIGAYFNLNWCSKGCFCFISLHKVHKITMRSKNGLFYALRLRSERIFMNIMKTYEGGEFKEIFRVQVWEGADFMKLQKGSYFINLHKFNSPSFDFAQDEFEREIGR